MVKHLNFNLQDVDKYLNEKNYSWVAKELNAAFKLEVVDCNPVPFEVSTQVINKLQHILSIINTHHIKNESLILELFRSLRNYVINSDVKNQLVNNADFLENVISVLKTFSKENVTTLKVSLQFLINFVVSNKKGAQKIHEKLFSSLLSLLKEGVQLNEVSALLYNISLHQQLYFNLDSCDCIIEQYESNLNCEYLHFLLETIITYDTFWTLFKDLNPKKRLTVLEIVREKQIQSGSINLSDQSIETLINLFIESENVIFQTALRKENSLEPYEVSKLVEIISSLSATHQNLKKLKCSKDLLINAAVVLINIHNLGKETDNYFSPIQNLGDLREPHAEIREHPAFGFKAELIRIIANLSWGDKIMQDLVREAEVIPIILDSCNMDARNPLILQWSILAIHNLCENNLENQQIIAGLHQQGVVDSSTLGELGITLESDGNNTIKIVPLEALKK